MAQVTRSRKVYPVIVVGSGASGGMAAWNLTRKGINVLLLDAGTKFERSQFWTHVRPWEARARRARGEKPPQFFLDTKEQPYLTPEGKPFQLIRVWGHGGKTNVWGRVSLRYADLDFKGPAQDGWEIPWPIEYKDVAPYYDQVDQLIGVCGGDDDSDSLPGSKFHMPPPAPRCGEVLLSKAFAKTNIPIVAGRRANRTKPLRGYPACHYCGNCGAGCDTGSFFCSADHLLPDAIKTGKLELRSNAVVARVLVDDNGLANGVQYFDRVTGKEERVYAKVVVMGASAVDTTRILLNSKSDKHPNGIGNGSDVIGRYLCEQLRVHVAGFLPQLYGNGVQNDLGIGGEHIYMPRFNHRLKNLNYLRGFQMQFWNTGLPALQPAARRQSQRRLRRRHEGRHQAQVPGVGGAAPVRRDAAVQAQPHHRGREPARSLRRAEAEGRLSRSATTSGRWPTTSSTCSTRWGRPPASSGFTSSAASSTATARPSTSTAAAAWARTRSARRSTSGTRCTK